MTMKLLTVNVTLKTITMYKTLNTIQPQQMWCITVTTTVTTICVVDTAYKI